MDIERLSRFGGAVKERASLIWKLVKVQSERWLKWLQLRSQVQTKLFLASTGIGIVLLLVAFWYWYSFEQTDHNGVIHHPHADILNPIAAALGGAVLAWAALRQARTATRQAEIASERHKEQTDADRQQRLTESYSKAVEQLASEKIEERLGGIYTLEQISQESLSRYWTVMETLSAFVRERSQRNYAEFKKSDERISQVAYALWEQKGKPERKDDEIWAEATQRGEPPATDIAAVLTVIKRRDKKNWEREHINKWCFDLREAVLKRANLVGAHLEQATLWGAHLEEANLWGARLKEASLIGAHLEQAHLVGARLELTNLQGAHLEGANLKDAHLREANLRDTSDVSTEMLRNAHGDAATRLPNGVERPPHWPPAADDAGPAAA
jgi:Protein of unknown function (DUF2934)/Pentapeptide repeats (8 copies)